MRLNTTKSLELARRAKDLYGTWQEVIDASRLEGGVYVVCRPPKGRGDMPDEVGSAPA